MKDALREKFEEQAQQLGYLIGRSLVNEEGYQSNETQAAWALVQACQPEGVYLIEGTSFNPRLGYRTSVEQVFVGSQEDARAYAKERSAKSGSKQYRALKASVKK